MAKSNNEYILQKQICQYLSLKYKNVLFLSDTIASIKLSIPQSVRNKQIQKNGFKCPDLIILQPNRNYKGLFIELKLKSPFKKNGEIFSNEHLKGQQDTILKLNSLGYYACFSWGFEMTKSIIDAYLNEKL